MSAVVNNVAIDHVLEEQRRFEPPKDFPKGAHVRSLEEYQQLYRQSIDDPQAFWAEAVLTACRAARRPPEVRVADGALNLTFDLPSHDYRVFTVEGQSR